MKMPKWSEMTRNQKIAGFLAVGLVCSGVLMRLQATTKVAYYEVSTQKVEQLVHLNAKISPKNKQEYSAQLPGVITVFNSQVGDLVKKDDVLVTMKSFDFATKQTGFDQAMKALLVTKTNLAADTTVKIEEIAKVYEASNTLILQGLSGYDSVQKLYRDQMVSDAAYRESLTQLKAAILKYLNDNKQILADVSAIYANDLDKTKEIAAVNAIFEPLYSLKLLLEPQVTNDKVTEPPTEVISPIEIKAVADGSITKHTGDVNLFIPVGGSLIETGDLSILNAEMEIPVVYLADVKLGTEVRVKDQSGKVINGKIKFIDSTITDQMASDGSIVKLVKIKAEFAEKPDLKIYETQSVSVVAKQSDSAVVVPDELIIEKKGESYVWMNIDGVLTEKPVVVDFKVDGLVVIKTGVLVGDKLVMDTKLKPGQKIKF